MPLIAGEEEVGRRKVKTGCSGWSYEDWQGPFYPEAIQPKGYLPFYASVFDVVEVDSSFYGIPSPSLVDRWRRVTPDDFEFCPKLSKQITHDTKLEEIEPTLSDFYSAVKRLGGKLGPIVIQLPPSVKKETHFEALESLFAKLDPGATHVVEFRHWSWFTSSVYEMLERYRVSMAWSVSMYLSTPPEVTGDLIYLRFIGDRTLTRFGELQKDRTGEVAKWADVVREKLPKGKSAYVFSNNHYAGFGPGTINMFRRFIGLRELDWTGFG